jgi:hypothetical protein
LQDLDYPHGARIQWGRHFSSEYQWDEIATWGLETFGLPGDRYITDVNVNDMTWWFSDPRDQTLFVLRNGQAQCIELSCKT